MQEQVLVVCLSSSQLFDAGAAGQDSGHALAASASVGRHCFKAVCRIRWLGTCTGLYVQSTGGVRCSDVEWLAWSWGGASGGKWVCVWFPVSCRASCDWHTRKRNLEGTVDFHAGLCHDWHVTHFMYGGRIMPNESNVTAYYSQFRWRKVSVRAESQY